MGYLQKQVGYGKKLVYSARSNLFPDFVLLILQEIINKRYMFIANIFSIIRNRFFKVLRPSLYSRKDSSQMIIKFSKINQLFLVSRSINFTSFLQFFLWSRILRFKYSKSLLVETCCSGSNLIDSIAMITSLKNLVFFVFIWIGIETRKWGFARPEISACFVSLLLYIFFGFWLYGMDGGNLLSDVYGIV